MSIVLSLLNVNLPPNSNPKLVQTYSGFPAKNLKGLYLAEDGSVGQQHIGTAADSGPFGNHASLRGSYLQPVVRDFGYELGAGGGLFVTPFPILGSEGKVTCVVAASLSGGMVTLASGQYVQHLGQASMAPSGPAASWAQTNMVGVNGITGVTNGQLTGQNVGVYRQANWPITPPGSRIALRNNPTLVVPHIVGFTYDAVSGEYIAKAYGGSRAALTGVANLFTELSSQSGWAFGLSQLAGSQQLATANRFYGFATYHDFGEVLLDQAMAAMASRLASRGVSVP